jgi:hypothetical protein
MFSFDRLIQSPDSMYHVTDVDPLFGGAPLSASALNVYRLKFCFCITKVDTNNIITKIKARDFVLIALTLKFPSQLCAIGVVNQLID